MSEFVHFYTVKRHGKPLYRLLCSNDWVTDTQTYRDIVGRKLGVKKQFVTSDRNVTCLECMDKLIHRRELELRSLKLRLLNARS